MWALLCSYVWKQSNMIHEKISLQYLVCAGIWAIYLVAWSGNNQSLCLCSWFPSLAFYLTCWIMNPTSVWVLTAVGAQVQVPSHYCSCNIILLLGWCDFITIKAQCLLTSCRQTTQVKFYCCQHGQRSSCMLVKTLWLAVNNLYGRYRAKKQFSCLGTIVWQPSNIVQQGVFCFQTSSGYKRIFVQSREKSIFCMQYVCKVHCKYVVAHAYNIVAKIQSSSGWAFLGCAALSATHTGFGKYLRAAAAQVTSVVWPLVLQSDLLWDED